MQSLILMHQMYEQQFTIMDNFFLTCHSAHFNISQMCTYRCACTDTRTYWVIDLEGVKKLIVPLKDSLRIILVTRRMCIWHLPLGWGNEKSSYWKSRYWRGSNVYLKKNQPLKNLNCSTSAQSANFFLNMLVKVKLDLVILY